MNYKKIPKTNRGAEIGNYLVHVAALKAATIPVSPSHGNTCTVSFKTSTIRLVAVFAKLDSQKPCLGQSYLLSAKHLLLAQPSSFSYILRSGALMQGGKPSRGPASGVRGRMNRPHLPQ